MPSASLSLRDVAGAESVVVAAVGGERSFRRRLMEMGLVPGTPVRIVARAPLGDPLTIELRGARLSIRLQEAAEVTIRR